MGGNATIERVTSLMRERRFPEAARALISGASTGDVAALTELAQWRISGNLIRRDLADARTLLARAGEAGNLEASLLHTYFLASGTGGPDDWPAALSSLRRLSSRHPGAKAQLRLIDAMALDPGGLPATPLSARQLSAEPLALVLEGFLTAAECEYLIKAGMPALQPSLVVDPASGGMVPHPVRSSDAAMFGVHSEDLVVNAVNRRIAVATGTSIAQGEPLQLLRYEPGGEYRAHMDALPGEPNQRVLTVLLYLSEDYDGGDTAFLRTGHSYKGRTGDALLFRNVTGDGRPDPKSLHAGRPVRRGTKLLASRWIRREAFTFPPPRPLLQI
jgi:prolyl 4-hydroxylase